MSCFIPLQNWMGKVILKLLRWNALDLCKENGCLGFFNMMSPVIIWLYWNTQIKQVPYSILPIDLLKQCSISVQMYLTSAHNFNSFRCSHVCFIPRCFMALLDHTLLWILSGWHEKSDAVSCKCLAFWVSLSNRWANKSTSCVLLCFSYFDV